MARTLLQELAKRAPLVILAAYIVAALHVLASAQFNPLALARMSREFPAERFWDQSPPLEDGLGYDGQFFYYIARQPWPDSSDTSYLDAPAYRYQRILYPVLANFLALGQPPLIGWTLIVVNLLALALGFVAAAHIIDLYGRSRWWLLAYAANPALILGLFLDLSEPLALALCTVGIWAYLKQRTVAAGLALSLAVLARETMAIVPAGLLVWELAALKSRGGSGRRTASFLLPLCVGALWQLVVRLRLGSAGSSAALEQLAVPLTAPVERLHWFIVQLSDSGSSDPANELTGLVALTGLLLLSLTALAGFRRPSPWGWLLGVQGVLLLCLSWRVWGEPLNAGRAAMLLYLFNLLLVLEAGRVTPMNRWLRRPKEGETSFDARTLRTAG